MYLYIIHLFIHFIIYLFIHLYFPNKLRGTFVKTASLKPLSGSISVDSGWVALISDKKLHTMRHRESGEFPKSSTKCRLRSISNVKNHIRLVRLVHTSMVKNIIGEEHQTGTQDSLLLVGFSVQKAAGLIVRNPPGVNGHRRTNRCVEVLAW